MIHPAIVAWMSARSVTDPVRSVESARWSTSTPTAIVTRSDGSRLVVQAFANPLVAERSRNGAALLARIGLPVPTVLEETSWYGETLLVSAHIRGLPGPDLLGTPEAATVARCMGHTAARLREGRAPSEGVGPWLDLESLVGAAERWASAQRDPELAKQVRAAAAGLSAGWTPVPSHGDFVPANALFTDGRMVGLVDTVDVDVRHPMVDVAWWCLVVRHYHRAEFEWLLPTFLEAGGLTVSDTLLAQLAQVAVVRASELASAKSPAAGFTLPLLHAAVAWVRDTPSGQ